MFDMTAESAANRKMQRMNLKMIDRSFAVSFDTLTLLRPTFLWSMDVSRRQRVTIIPVPAFFSTKGYDHASSLDSPSFLCGNPDRRLFHAERVADCRGHCP